MAAPAPPPRRPAARRPGAREAGTPGRETSDRATSDVVLDAAERLAQTRGFNGFSYADVSAEVGITTASLHYHFPGKADLGRALVERYTASFQAALRGIAAREARAAARLEGYARLYGDVLASGRMCLCGMLAAEYETLPPPVQRTVRGFFDSDKTWVAGVLERGREAGELHFSGSARDAARQWTSTLEGSMLLARPFGDAARLTAAARRMIDDLTRRPAGSPRGRVKATDRPRR